MCSGVQCVCVPNRPVYVQKMILVNEVCVLFWKQYQRRYRTPAQLSKEIAGVSSDHRSLGLSCFSSSSSSSSSAAAAAAVAASSSSSSLIDHLPRTAPGLMNEASASLLLLSSSKISPPKDAATFVSPSDRPASLSITHSIPLHQVSVPSVYHPSSPQEFFTPSAYPVHMNHVPASHMHHQASSVDIFYPNPSMQPSPLQHLPQLQSLSQSGLRYFDIALPPIPPSRPPATSLLAPAISTHQTPGAVRHTSASMRRAASSFFEAPIPAVDMVMSSKTEVQPANVGELRSATTCTSTIVANLSAAATAAPVAQPVTATDSDSHSQSDSECTSDSDDKPAMATAPVLPPVVAASSNVLSRFLHSVSDRA